MIKRKNNGGFTLAELIVALTVLGIITLLALPMIGNINMIMSENKEETYKNILEYSAKLYVDSHSIDLFGYQNSGCVDISYEQLINSKLMEDIDFSTHGINSSDVFVRVRKANDVYLYESHLRKNETDEEEQKCDGSIVDEGPVVSISPNGTSSPKKTSDLKNVIKVIVKDDYGFAANISFKYKWIDAKTGNTVGTEVTKNFKNKAVAGSQEQNVTIAPPNSNGDFKLVVTPINIKDYMGNATMTEITSEIFSIDNT